MTTCHTTVAICLLLAACGGTSGPGEPVTPAAVDVIGQGADQIFRLVPEGSRTPSSVNGTDFGSWSAGTIGNPIAPKVKTFEVLNVGGSQVLLRGPPFVEVTGNDAARFSVHDVSAATLATGQAEQFTIAFDGLGLLGPHAAEAVVHLPDRDFMFTVTGTSASPSGD